MALARINPSGNLIFQGGRGSYDEYQNYCLISPCSNLLPSREEGQTPSPQAGEGRGDIASNYSKFIRTRIPALTTYLFPEVPTHPRSLRPLALRTAGSAFSSGTHITVAGRNFRFRGRGGFQTRPLSRGIQTQILADGIDRGLRATIRNHCQQ